jgi:hypothetical protein
MIKNHTSIIALFFTAVANAAAVVTASPGQIANETLSVQYDAAGHTFTLTDRAAAQVFVKNGRLDDAGAILREDAVTDPVFGTGRRIVVARNGGGGIALEVYPDLPFALVREVIKNEQTTQTDIQKAVPAIFTLNLDKPAGDLKTLGTGGLLAPDKNPGSYLFLTCADPATREGVVAGWVTQKKGSGAVFSSVNEGKVEFKAQTEHGHLILKPGESVALDIFAIGHFQDARLGEEAFASAVAKAHGIHLRPKQAVYCSWYAEGKDHGGAGTAETTAELAKFCAKENLSAYGLGVIQLDDRWQAGPQIGGPATHFDRVNPNGPYKNGMAPTAKVVAAEGLDFGLWWLPFGRNHMEADYKDKQDWFWKKADGSPLRQKSFGGTCLDSSVPAVQEHLETLGRTIRSWGVKYYKMDGLNTGVGVDHCYINDGYKADGFGSGLPAHDPSLTNIEVMRKGLGFIRKGAGDEVFFSGCCAVQNMRTYACTIGLVDSMRVGPDFNHDGQGIRSGPLRGSWVYFLNGKVWWNDPDPTKVRTSSEGCDADHSIDGAVTLAQAQMTSSWVSLTDQFFLISDWLPNLPKERLDILRHTMASHGATTRPVDRFDNSLPNTWLLSSDKSGVRRDVAGFFNFYDAPLKVEYSLAKMGLDPAKTYHAFDFWADKPVADISRSIKEDVPPMSCRVLGLRAKENHPVLISTSSHVSSGILEVKQEKWSENTLSGVSAVIGKDSYELRITGLRDGGQQWVPTAAVVSNEDAAAGVKISQTLEAGLLRVKIVSPVSRDVKWRVAFKPEAVQPEKAQNLKAAAKSPYDPVLLAWESTAPFHTITRDGEVIARGYFGQSYADASAPRGKSHAYTVAVEGGAPLPAVSVAVPDFPAAPPLPEVKVDELTPVSVKNGWGESKPGKAIDGGPLTVAGKVCASGIGVHAPAEVVYARQLEWKRFVAHVGLSESQREFAATSVVCKVIAEDSKGEKIELLVSPVMRFGGMDRFPIDVVLPGDCAKVRLVVDDGGDGIRCDHANWGDAGFMK